MFILKACARCGGDLYVNSDGDRSCLQCGFDPGPFADVLMLRQPGIAAAYLNAMTNGVLSSAKHRQPSLTER